MGIKGVLKKLLRITEWIVFICLIVILFLIASPLLPTSKYISTHVVPTGSMEPTIKTGSIVFSMQKELLENGDIIIFTSPEDNEVTIIHRIIDIKSEDSTNIYTTKGDNNEKEDRWVVTDTEVKGEMLFSVPYLGHLVAWLKTTNGFITILIVPALLFAIFQIRKIKEGIDEEVQRRTKIEVEKYLTKLKDTPVSIFIIVLLIPIFLLNFSKIHALFTDSVSITEITISTGIWEESEPSVIINEVMWAGSSISTSDQWIELKNNTDEDINIGKWKIENARRLGQPDLMIPANSILRANSYFLISNHNHNTPHTGLGVIVDMNNASIDLLHTGNGHLILKDEKGTVIDKAYGYPVWASGIFGTTFHSMQRVNSSDGLNTDNWLPCIDISCTDTIYWKLNVENTYGTPKNENIF
jgi:signal peptidase I